MVPSKRYEELIEEAQELIKKYPTVSVIQRLSDLMEGKASERSCFFLADPTMCCGNTILTLRHPNLMIWDSKPMLEIGKPFTTTNEKIATRKWWQGIMLAGMLYASRYLGTGQLIYMTGWDGASAACVSILEELGFTMVCKTRNPAHSGRPMGTWVCATINGASFGKEYDGPFCKA